METDFTTWFFEPKVIKPFKIKKKHTAEKIFIAVTTIAVLSFLVWSLWHASQVDKLIFTGKL